MNPAFARDHREEHRVVDPMLLTLRHILAPRLLVGGGGDESRVIVFSKHFSEKKII